MTFHASLSLVAFSASSVFLLGANLFVHPTSFYAVILVQFSSIIPIVTRCSSFSLFIKWPKKIAWRSRILFMTDLVSAFRNTVSFNFFVVHEIRYILEADTFLLPSVSFVHRLFGFSRD